MKLKINSVVPDKSAISFDLAQEQISQTGDPSGNNTLIVQGLLDYSKWKGLSKSISKSIRYYRAVFQTIAVAMTVVISVHCFIFLILSFNRFLPDNNLATSLISLIISFVIAMAAYFMAHDENWAVRYAVDKKAKHCDAVQALVKDAGISWIEIHNRIYSIERYSEFFHKYREYSVHNMDFVYDRNEKTWPFKFSYRYVLPSGDIHNESLGMYLSVTSNVEIPRGDIVIDFVHMTAHIGTSEEGAYEQ